LQALLGRAYFLNGEFEQAIIATQRAKDSLSSVSDDEERTEMGRNIDVLMRKIELDMTSATRVGNVNDAAYVGGGDVRSMPKKLAPVVDTRYDWYQNATHVFLSFRVASAQVAEQTEINFQEDHIELRFEESYINLELSSKIVSEESSKTTTAKKIELKLRKAVENEAWLKVEKAGETKLLATAQIQPGQSQPPSYPSSSKTKKDWSQLDKQIQKDLEKEKPEGDAALNTLFKQIYERSDEATRRAMIKSYQTSGGTVLSTNWDEVKEKDYEGRDRPDAPEGQQWAKDL